jgi:predicted methyltransferase
MAEKAVSLGTRIVVAATVASTLRPTKDLILDAARRANRTVQIIEVLCEAAWKKFEQSDQEGYLQEIARQLFHAAHLGDVIVLAQASMAAAADLCPDLPLPILSSPRLGLEAALKAYHAA